MLRIGLAGFSQGYYAVTYTRYLVARQDVICAGVCDLGMSDSYVQECAFITAGQFARELDAPHFTCFSDLLDTNPDAILVCCETYLHTELAAQALTRGIHVFVSKPLSFDPEDFPPLLTVAENAILLCGNPLRYHPDIINLAKRVAAGETGKPYLLSCVVCHQAMVHQAWERDPELSGGNLGTYSPYLFDLPRWIIGEEIISLYAQGGNFNTPQITFADTIHITGRLKSGGMIAIELRSGIKQPHPFFQAQVAGTKGWISITCEDHAASSSSDETTDDLGTLKESSLGAAEMDHFIDCILKDETPACDVYNMEYSAACIRAVQKSMVSAQPEMVEVQECYVVP